MENVIDVAKYISKRYFEENGSNIDEMKLHKMMYFAQREAYIQTGEPLFNATFYGWKYGPILKEVRNNFDQLLNFENKFLLLDNHQKLFDRIFFEYSKKDSWSLSRLTHGEISWKNSRLNISENENSDNAISNEDIKKDAERILNRRLKLKNMGFN